MLRKLVTVLLLLAFMNGCSSAVPALSTPAAKSPTATRIPVTNTVPAPTDTPISSTEIPAPEAWTVVDGSPAMNQIRTLLIDQSGDLWAGGPAGLVHWDLDSGVPTVYVTGVQHEYTNVVALVQAPDDAIWVGTFGNGIGIFDGANWQSLNAENGLPGNYVISLTRAGTEEIWADLKKMPYSADDGQDYFFGHFDGTRWMEEVGGGFTWVIGAPAGSVIGAYNYPSGSHDFRSDVATYDGQAWNLLTYFPHEYMDAITIAPDNAIWIATWAHLFRYAGRTLHKIIPPWAEEYFPSVSSIAVAEDGTAWFGFSYASFVEYPCGSRWDTKEEQGVYRYDGTTWTHFTTEDGLVDNKICAVALGPSGNVCFGSFDQGVSCFDGVDWKTYRIP